MARITLKQCCESRLPEVIGACSADIGSVAAAANSADERLLYAREAGDEGWVGSFAEVVYNVLQTDPYISLDRYAGRLISVDVCRSPVEVQNQFYEYLQFGNGRQPRFNCTGSTVAAQCTFGQVYDRGFFPAFRDITAGHIIRVRAIDPLDVNTGKRTLIQGTDTADHIIYSQDGALRVQGEYIYIGSPFTDMPQPINSLTGIQKDITNGQITYWDVDPVTAAETLILTMEPGELVAGYRRYYLSHLPPSCCPVVLNQAGQRTVQVQALIKLNLVPARVPTDYLLCQSMEAIIAECQSMRYSTMDLPNAKQMALMAHRDAIRLLNGQLTHYYGTQKPAISFYPFGSAKLENQKIGTMI